MFVSGTSVKAWRHTSSLPHGRLKIYLVVLVLASPYAVHIAMSVASCPGLSEFLGDHRLMDKDILLI